MIKNTGNNNIVVFGKGGVGKSTFSSNLSAYYAGRGLKALHIGCDPKGDSTMSLLEDIDSLTTVMSWISNAENQRDPGVVFNQGRLGIKCVESGGPEAGIGCGGRGIARVMEYLDKWNILAKGEFDTVVFDVLGDVVCGGFAAPLRKGFGNKVVIVIAEDEMSYYAANNIARAVLRYSVNGVALAGIVVNDRGGGGPKQKAAEFASLLGARILGVLPVSETPALARRNGLTAIEYDPESEFSVQVASIAEKLLAMNMSGVPLPTPLDQKAFMRYIMNLEEPDGFSPAKKKAAAPAPAASASQDAPPRPAGNEEMDARTVDAFSLLLGLRGSKQATQGYDVSFVEDIAGGGIRIGFSGPAIGSPSVSLIPSGLKDEPDIAAANFDIFLGEGTICAPIVRLLQRVAHRLGNFKIRELENIYRKCLESDRMPGPDGMPGPYGMPGPDGTPGPGSSGSGEPGQSGKWARFFARHQFSRNKSQMLFYDIPVSQISHTDIECRFATPQINCDEFIPYNYPWISPGMEPAIEFFNQESAHYSTDVREMDVIMGSGEKLSSLVSRAIEEIGSRRLLIFSNTCVPVVYGEDVPSIIASFKQSCSAPIFYQGPENSISVNPFNEFFVSLKKEVGFQEGKRSPRAVNLIGFPERKGLEEIITALNMTGIEVNATFIPKINLNILENYRSAALTVFYPDEDYNEMYEQIFGDVPVKAIKPKAPYGMSGTREWLAEVARALGLGDSHLALSAKMENEQRGEWNRLVDEAGKHTLGFVLSGEGAETLSKPERAGGVPMMDAVREMGFNTRILQHRPAAHGRGRAAAPDTESVKGAALFSTPEELEDLMAATPAGCFYSDYYFDPRAVKAGKGQFSLQFFEMGYAGAVRSLRRILGACSSPFYERYGKYMLPGKG